MEGDPKQTSATIWTRTTMKKRQVSFGHKQQNQRTVNDRCYVVIALEVAREACLDNVNRPHITALVKVSGFSNDRLPLTAVW